MSFPKMNSAFFTSWTVTSDPGIKFIWIIFVKSDTDGCPTIAYSFLALTACSYSLLVTILLFPLTVDTWKLINISLIS
eukprot:10017458-Ditylum_brightwellii.AAC.2